MTAWIRLRLYLCSCDHLHSRSIYARAHFCDEGALAMVGYSAETRPKKTKRGGGQQPIGKPPAAGGSAPLCRFSLSLCLFIFRRHTGRFLLSCLHGRIWLMHSNEKGVCGRARCDSGYRKERILSAALVMTLVQRQRAYICLLSVHKNRKEQKKEKKETVPSKTGPPLQNAPSTQH
jgi:hypothetical protein